MKPSIMAKKVWNHAVERTYEIKVKGQYGSAPLSDYPGVLTLFASAQAAVAFGDEEWIEEIRKRLARFPYEFEERDMYFMHRFCNYRVGSLGKGFMFMKGYFDEQTNIIREYAEMTMNEPKSPEGILRHFREPDKIWIDVVFCITPFMLYAGLTLNEPKIIDFAVEQCFKMYDVFMDKSNGLLHQTRGFLEDKTKLSEDHWSRGNGWGIIGLTELVKYLPKDSKHYTEAVSRFQAHCAALIKYQDYRGLWRQEIPEPLAWEETSGTGIFLYAIGAGIRLGLLDRETYFPVLKNGVEGLCKYCINPDYSIEKCCAGCCCPGEGAMKGTVEAYLVHVMPRKDDGHGFGPVIMALTEAERNGIENIAWNR